VIAESAIGAGTAFCSALLARLLFPGRAADRAAILAAGITAFYPYYIVHDTSLEETSLFTLLTIVSVIVSMKAAHLHGGRLLPMVAGFVLGLDVLTRKYCSLCGVGSLLALLEKGTARWNCLRTLPGASGASLDVAQLRPGRYAIA